MSEVVTFSHLPNINPEQLHPIDVDALVAPGTPRHPPRILVLYGSLRERSYSRFASDLTDRYSERVETAENLSRRVNQNSH